MTPRAVLIFEILCPAVPLEIVGTICGHPFYYRGRHERWSIYHDIYDYADDRIRGKPLANGKCTGENDGKEADMDFAITQILSHFQDVIYNVVYPES